MAAAICHAEKMAALLVNESPQWQACPGVELFEAERYAVIGVGRHKSLFDER